ncbi:MAG: hypothetical protein Q3992_01385 [Bacteroides sp.]|nr:hypothetical protein [Bacteroides sp.]
MKNLLNAFMFIGALMVVVGAAAYITKWEYAKYIFTVGAGMYALYVVNTPIAVQTATTRRLRVQQIFGALGLIVTGLFMITTRGNEWIAALLVSAILILYTAIRIPQEIKKENNRQ